MADVGFARFSAREVAKRIGYSIGTLYNVFGTYDQLIIAINTRTFVLWTDYIREALSKSGDDRIRALVEGYFGFARGNRNAWMAIYDHHLPPDVTMPPEHDLLRGQLTDVVVEEVRAVLSPECQVEAPRLARSLVATVHGHCMFDINGSFALMGEKEPMAMALARVRESLTATRGSC
ncbi:TetR/AcrR family transcriptional regulator [Novosphingobium barchaimii]|nr:TetR/AcrR family transcriptional regulator [Novosphingobium barchaimii]